MIKNKLIKKTSVVIGLVILILFATTIINSEKSGSDNKILIAGNAPISGPLAMYGETLRDGTDFAIKHLGENSNIEIDWQDNKGEIKTSVSVLQRQLAQNPDIYISGLKPQTQAITDAVTEAKIPHFTWILDTEINPNSDNNFRTWVNFKLEAELFLDYSSKKQLDKVAIVYVNLPSAETEYQDIVIPGLKSQGVSDIYVERFSLDKTDMGDTALKIKNYDPDLLIINGFLPQMVNLVNDLDNFGFEFEGKTLASIDMLDASANLSPETLEGIVVAAPKFLVDNNQEYANWKKEFKETYNYEPLYHHAYAYDMMLVINESIKDGKFTNKENLSTVNIQGITGNLKFDEDQSLITEMVLAVYRNGVLIEMN